MPDASNDEHNTAGEASVQQGNTESSSEHESSKPKDPLESSHNNDPGSRQQTKHKVGFKTKGKCTKSHSR